MRFRFHRSSPVLIVSVGVVIILLDQLMLGRQSAGAGIRLWSLLLTGTLLAVCWVSMCWWMKQAAQGPPADSGPPARQDGPMPHEEMIRTEKLRMAGTLAAGIAHEIRNPLTSLRGFLQLSAQKDPTYTDIMISELDRINTIVNEMLELASPKESVFEPRLLQPMIQSVILLLQPQATMYGIQLVGQYSKETGFLSVRCSESKLKQVFINLVKNAIEVMSDGGTIIISLSSDGKRVAVDIADEGPGMPRELMEKIGEPFVTTKQHGTGLGLMVCQRIIDDHQGTLAFRSSWKGGTVVTVKLPIFYGNGGL